MAETLALLEFVIIALLILVIYLQADTIASKRIQLEKVYKERKDAQSLILADFHANVPESAKQAVRGMTAKDIAAGNLNRQVVRKSKSWADIRARVETLSDMDPETQRSKRVERFNGNLEN
jgi:hypothetical protein